MKKHVVMDSIVISNMAVYKTKYIKQKNNKCIKQKKHCTFFVDDKKDNYHILSFCLNTPYTHVQDFGFIAVANMLIYKCDGFR